MARVAEYPETAAPRRRGGRGLIIFLVILLVLLGLAFAADRIAANVAEGEVTKRLVAKAEERGVTAASTDVSIGGFPFLDQVVKGKYDQVTITMHDAKAQQVSLNELVVVASGVNADTAQLLQGNGGDISADTITGTAVIDWAGLAGLTDYSKYGIKNIKFAPDGDKVRVTGSTRIPVVNLDVDFNTTGTIGVKGGKIEMKVADLQIVKGDELSVNVKALLPQFVDGLANNLSQAIVPPELPYGLVITDVHPEPEGLSVSAEAKGVPISG